MTVSHCLPCGEVGFELHAITKRAERAGFLPPDALTRIGLLRRRRSECAEAGHIQQAVKNRQTA